MCARPAAPVLTSDLPLQGGIHQSGDGVADLKWGGTDAASFELEERVSGGGFKLRYQGSDRASIRSGLAAGTYHFRIRAADSGGLVSPWSDELAVEVTYMDAARLRLLLILGAIVVLATVGAILHGHASHSGKEETR